MAGKSTMTNFDFKLTWALPFGFFLILNILNFAEGDPQVPCYFIFGDSLADAGSNNELETVTKANYPPYGVDFPLGATGRFTNGRTMFDVITENLGFDHFIPPFPMATGNQILQGVNYASAGSGILEETAKDLGERVWLARQLEQHTTVVSRIKGMLGNQNASDHLGKCLYMICIGSNDYINNYYKPEYYTTSKMFSPVRYADVLSKEYETNLRLLHSLGANKIAVVGLSAVGCALTMVEKFGGQPYCVNKINNAVLQLNYRLQSMVHRLNHCTRNAKFTYVNLTSIFAAATPQFVHMNYTSSCCEKVKSLGTCVPHSTPCSERKNFELFDGFHPTEATNLVVGNIVFASNSLLEISPYTLKQLIAA